jgi:hypothetical protein
MKPHPWKQCRSGTGAALVIVLAFIVLLAAIMVIFFTQAISYRNQGASSYNNFKSTALAQSGLETVVGDLEQEITNGSQTVSYGTGTNVYYPTGNTNAVPQRSGNPALVNGGDPTPNLIRISVRTETYPTGSPAVSSRASADSSTNAAAFGQYISLARWNQHYLLPRANPGSTTIDTTPTNAFNAPDWVYVTSGGPTVITAPSSKVIGRYAYAIYDEGGLLDANVAGFPSNTSTNAVHPASPTTYYTNSYGAALPMWGSGLKGTEAFADLTVPIPIGSTTAPMFSQTQINQLVGWRNNATAQPAGTYNAYTFSVNSAVNYHDWMVNTTNGYLTTSGNSWSDPTTGKTDTDQVFASRQALIAFINDAGMSQDALQYLGTFTRDTEQPCYNPPVGRPMVQSAMNNDAYTYHPNSSTFIGFGTGNDAHGVDRYSSTNPTTNSPTDINPPFLSERVTGTFTRADNTTAQIGEPLIKERFPLSRLSLFPTNEGTPSAANAALIYQYFGLTKQSSGVWYYNHDASNTTGIDRLNAVAALNREPDFFELLKAAINVGSVGKGCAYNASNNSGDNWTTSGSVGNLLQAHDTISALQILQIGANIIDQYKADNFPTRIQFSGDTSSPPNIVCGSEDLPYLYRVRNWFTEYNSTQIAGLIQPELWDPYSYNSGAASGLGSSGFLSSSNTPKLFRVRLEPDPSVPSGNSPVVCTEYYNYNVVNPAPPPNSIVQTDTFTTTGSVTLNYPNYQPSTSTTPNPAPMTFSAGELNGCWGFREPTLLAAPSLCPTAYLNSGNSAAASYTDSNTHLVMTGFTVITLPTTRPQPLATYAPVGIESILKIAYTPNSEPSCLRMYLDYQDPVSSNWINYDQQVIQYQGGSSSLDLHTIANYTLYDSGTPSTKIAMQNLDWCGWVRTDPRSSRWGAMYSEYFYSLPIVDASNNEFGSERADGNISFGSHLGARNDYGFFGTGGYGKQYRGYQHGYAAENSVRQTAQSDGETGNLANLRYYLDPDGIPRRAMAGYVTDAPYANGSYNYTGNNGGTAPSTSQPLYGLPMAVASGSANNSYAAVTTSAVAPNYGSRPTILHRPFRSVAELGYAFRDTPWGNINFTFPESGDSPLLDVFCINDTSSTAGLVAGRVDLNTRQTPVLAALISGSLQDKDDPTTPALSQTMASQLAAQLVLRTMTTASTGTTQGPLISRADLVGTWIGAATPSAAAAALTAVINVPDPPDPDTYYTGFSHDIGTTAVPKINGTPTVALIPRQRDAVMRALTDSGSTRTWNLLIDLVAQSGTFPPKSTAFPNFVVEGEKHYWLHVALDRYTGKIIGSQLEVVSE